MEISNACLSIKSDRLDPNWIIYFILLAFKFKFSLIIHLFSRQKSELKKLFAQHGLILGGCRFNKYTNFM